MYSPAVQDLYAPICSNVPVMIQTNNNRYMYSQTSTMYRYAKYIQITGALMPQPLIHQWNCSNMEMLHHSSCKYTHRLDFKLLYLLVIAFCSKWIPMQTYTTVNDAQVHKTVQKNITMLQALFTALHATRSSDENSVRLSVRHTRALWQNGTNICPDLYTIRKII